VSPARSPLEAARYDVARAIAKAAAKQLVAGKRPNLARD
jgi:hypothetical protein